jgi:hypothetical protein
MTYALTTVKDAPYNAVGNDIADDTAAFQAMIDASAPGHLLGPVDQIFPIIIPPGKYKVGQINATNINGLTIIGIGSGSTYPILDWSGSPTNTMLDCTGSGAGLNFSNFQLRGPISDGPNGSYPAMGLLLTVTVAGGGNYCSLENFNVGGRFRVAAQYIYGVCCSKMSMCGANNYVQGNPSTFAAVYTATNATFGVTSDFVAIAKGFQGCSDWLMERCEMHCFTGGATISGKALLLEGTTGMTFNNGQIASAQGYLIQFNSNVALTSFNGVTFYTDQGPKGFTCIGGIAGSAANHLVMTNCYVQLDTGGTLYNLSPSSVRGTFIGGTIERGAVVTQYDICPIGSAPAAFGAPL